MKHDAWQMTSDGGGNADDGRDDNDDEDVTAIGGLLEIGAGADVERVVVTSCGWFMKLLNGFDGMNEIL